MVGDDDIHKSILAPVYRKGLIYKVASVVGVCVCGIYGLCGFGNILFVI